jgi:phage head maturation protease
VEIDPPDTTAGRDVVALVQRGDMTGMSFAFQVVRPHDERFERRDGQPQRIISDMAIQVSIVPGDAATDAQVAQRALQACREGHRIDWLRRWEMLRPEQKRIGPLWKRADARERVGAQQQKPKY